MNAPTLMTKRLTIRAIAPDDWEPYAESWANPAMTRFIGGQPRDRTTSWGKFLAGAGLWPLLGHGYWSFIETESGCYLGGGGLARFERGIAALEGHVEAGWAFAPHAWGKGYATEAMSAILDWADHHLPCTEVRAIIDHGNLASEGVARKCGFSVLLPAIPELPESALWRRPRT